MALTLSILVGANERKPIKNHPFQRSFQSNSKMTEKVALKQPISSPL
jgi:hypothetical protein